MKIFKDLNLDENTIKKLYFISNYENVSIKEYISKIITRELKNTIYLFNGYTYDIEKEILQDSNKKVIVLTNIENMIIKLLVESKDKLVDTEIILSTISHDDKMSIQSFRNKINYIRKKTYPDIILNISNRGYYINKLKLN